jgi:hypothetical protein
MALVLEAVRHSHVVGVPVVELEHRHRFLIGQRRVRAAEAFELLFIESGQAIIERLVFGMSALYELFRCQIFGKSTLVNYWLKGLFGFYSLKGKILYAEHEIEAYLYRNYHPPFK